MTNWKWNAARWRSRAGQLLAGLGVCAAGYVSLGTSCAHDEVSLSAQRTLSFAEDEPSKAVRVRVSPGQWQSLALDSSVPVSLARIGPDGEAMGGVASSLSLTCEEPEGCTQEIQVLVERGSLAGPFTVVLSATVIALASCGKAPDVMEVRIDVDQ